MRSRLSVGVVGVVGAVVLAMIASTSADGGASLVARAAGTSRDMPNAAPSALTPSVGDGSVRAIAQVGSRMVIGGTFTEVDGQQRSHLAAFSRTTGDLTDLSLSIGEVDAIVPGSQPGTAYIGGKFRRINGHPVSRVALINVATGRQVSGFKAARLDSGVVRDLRYRHGRLIVIGTFKRVGGAAHEGIVALNGRTGSVAKTIRFQLTGHHNQGSTGVRGRGPWSLDISPDGRRMIVIGNFKRAGGLVRDQIAMFAWVDRHWSLRKAWATKQYRPVCNPQTYDSYVRDVDFSPSGAFFVVSAAGGAVTGTLCDSSARFNTRSTGSDVKPVWVSRTGGDSLNAVEITQAAVFVGGHQRWANNPHGHDDSGAGAVPRPGLAALDPSNGLPLRWNPGRNPRGVSVFALKATGTGLYMGSDTCCIGIGATKVTRPKIAMFPWSGGSKLFRPGSEGLPGSAYLVKPTGSTFPMTRIAFTGTHARAFNRTDSFVDAGQVRGAFRAGKYVYYGANGMLHRTAFDGTTFGPAADVNPYQDSPWNGLYPGHLPTFYTQDLPKVRGMFLANNRLFFTKGKSVQLYWRYFQPDSGVVSEQLHKAIKPRAVSFTNARGMFKAGRHLYVTRKNGSLSRFTMRGTRVVGHSTTVSGPSVDGVNWENRTLFFDGS